MQDFERSRQQKSGNLKQSKYPAYHIWLSTRDMARIGYLMLREGQWSGRQIIPGASPWALLSGPFRAVNASILKSCVRGGPGCPDVS